jgi:hypothetical protein
MLAGGPLGGEPDDLARALAMSLGDNVVVSTDPVAEGSDGRNKEDQVRFPHSLRRPQLIRVARLHIFKPKIPIWVNFEVLQWKMYIGEFYGHCSCT